MSKHQAYPEYKDLGVEWLGRGPVSWELAKLKYKTTRVGDGLHSTPKYGEETGFYFVNGNNLVNGEIALTSSAKEVPEDEYLKHLVKLDHKSVLLSINGTIGNVARYNSEPIILGKSAAYINCSCDLLPEFLMYYLQSGEIQRYFDLEVTGTTISNLSLNSIKQLQVCMPNESEQAQIANFLDHETAKIDTLIEKKQQLIKLLKEKRQAVISHAVTKGLNQNSSMKDSGVEWLGEVPAHWGVLRLKHLIESLESGCSVNAADVPASANEVGVLKTSCVYTRTFRVEENKTVVSEDLHRVKCPVRKGAIIISRMNTPELVGASALVSEYAQNVYLPDRLWQTNFNEKVDLNSEYLAYFMTVEGFRVQISLAAEGASSSMQNIAKEDYLGINCLLPPLSEQQLIVEYIRLKLDYFEKLDNDANDAVKLLKERRTALISAAVTGKIDVRNWEQPND